MQRSRILRAIGLRVCAACLLIGRRRNGQNIFTGLAAERYTRSGKDAVCAIQKIGTDNIVADGERPLALHQKAAFG